MSQKYESYEVHDNLLFSVAGTRHGGQTFTPQVKHKLTSIKVWAYRAGTPSNFTIQIFLADANHKPTGSAIGSGTVSANAWTTNSAGALYEIALSVQPNLSKDVEYFIDMTCAGSYPSNVVNLKGKTAPSGYTRGYGGFTTSYPSSWDMSQNWDYYFEDWGDPIIDPPTVATNPATDIDFDRATLHGTLTNDGGEACQVRFHYGLTTDYGMTTEYQTGKVTGNTFQQEITGLQDEKTYHLKAEAKNSAGTAYGADAEFATTQEPLPEGKQVKALITHPAIKRVKVIFYDQEIADYDQLSNPEEQRIESSLEIPVPTPCTIEVTTLADQVFEFKIPLKS